MILAIDIGNTNIVLGVFDGETLTSVSRIATDVHKTDSEYAVSIQHILSLHEIKSEQVEGAILSSVVPPLTNTIVLALKTAYHVTPLVVGPGIKTGINLLVDNPLQVGADLICASVAAYAYYRPPVLVTDVGTATKMMVVDKNASFLGVSIIPGVKISLAALAGGAAQLPQISLDAPKRVLGRNTIDCMRSGVVYGNASMIDGMIDRIEAELGTSMTLVATGGMAHAIIPHCKHSITMDEDLILKGLYLMYQKNKR